MSAKPSSPEIPLPRGWPSQVKSAILHVISLAQFTLAYTRGWAANSPNSRIRLILTLGGRTPDEVYHRRCPMNRQPRSEPRANWPRRCPCAKPVTLVKGQPGAKLEMDVQFSGGRRHLPVVSLRRAA